MERLSGDFNRGYTKAIQDVTEVFTCIESDLRHHKKRLNQKLSLELLKVILENREKIRDDWGGFIRFNGKLNKFEYFKRERGN